ncbi:MocR-like pyridoxine biosynthesis transcription factor PdxR [Marinitenerispora sediminis]|uniref:GntR family transcriptional regulator n=1 Tax=Marinitenerispora sediminis TaxID=1931232 RepID=A0A368T2Z7_9ACTN|nr:PLP-dependent aminotransferase family protein [Marinitenerispora sediminis]RCV52182.1 GntR family transcriptional regulator [Marinitenerispora sediminis]RCV53101.1 GntR family transcriptional regulator [Marinitenerispora sediminis]RCV56224.1 GntR family transcriptional regulator [Marinitenerispora sediminis]
MVIDWATSGVDLLVDVDPADRGRRAGLERALRAAIRDGRLAPGTRLPASRTLAGELGVARGTVTAAYEQLVAEGYLSARRGSGTVVAELPASRIPDRGAAGDTGPVPRPRHDMRPGRPDLSAFPVEAWLRAARRVLPRMEVAAFALGDPRGHPALRADLAEYLGRTRGVLADPESIVVTNGFIQGIGLLARVLHESGRSVVAMEDPCYPFHREAVRRAGPSVVPLSVDAQGASGQVPEGAGAAVVTPAHQVVLGMVLAPERRRALVTWASSADGLIVEDDYDGEFRYDRQPVGALQQMSPEHVAYLGTASKTLAPGLRLGWMVLPRRFVEPVAEAKFYADSQTDIIGQLVLADLIRGHDYDRHVRAQRLRYRRRRDELLRRLAREVPEVRVRGAAAGLQLMLELPPGGPSETEVTDRAAARGLLIVPVGATWQAPNPDRRPSIGVGYATPPDHGYPAALDALVATLREALDA